MADPKRPGARPKVDDAHFRQLAMSGATRMQMSKEIGVSRQAISQRAQRLGLGQRLDANRPKKREALPQLCEAKYGLPLERVKELRRLGAMDAFRRQRQNSYNRGIEWRLTFNEWWKIWDDSGKWPMRGRELGGWVMGRVGDVGPYAQGNVYICDHSENARVRSARLIAQNRPQPPEKSLTFI